LSLGFLGRTANKELARDLGASMNKTLQGTIFDLLCEDAGLPNGVKDLVLASCSGRNALLTALQVERDISPRLSAVRVDPEKARIGAYLKSITVEGFRGIGPESILDLKPGPGVTLVLGRNGSGKSSFAEGLEFLLTGENKRWENRTAIWKEGWRNLHHRDKGRVAAEFALESVTGGARISKQWGDSEELKTVEGATVQRHGQAKSNLVELGWDTDIEDYRPFLSYSELGNLLDSPSKMYDAISSVLGLTELVEARELLAEQRKVRDKFSKNVKAKLAPLLERLNELEDPRAQACHAALDNKKKYDLEALAEYLSEGVESPAGGLEELRALSSLRPPEREAVEASAQDLRALVSRSQQLIGSQVDRAAQVAELLRAALGFHHVHGDGDCPVCKTPTALSQSWRTSAEDELVILEEEAEVAGKLQIRLKAAKQRARQLILRHSEYPAECGVDTALFNKASAVWGAGLALDEPLELAAHLEGAYQPFIEAMEKVISAARDELKTREDRWRPLAAELHVWLKEAREAEASKGAIKSLKSAEKWMRETEDKIRTQRFLPIGESARQNWEMLRQDSNVELSSVTLKGSGTKRSVALEVTVDGTEGAALGVMSQGELNSLALSLFLPRATLETSPFRFVVIDDPVQAMDPAKIDGLARVLEKAAANRQVIVFTHDDRLFDAVRRLGIPATAIEVSRRAGSVVKPRETLGPARRAIADAMAVARTPEVNNIVAGRVVPGFCRAAVEAALTELVRRRQLEKGYTHERVERALDEASTLRKLVALFFWDDVGRGGDVKQRLAQLGPYHLRTFNSPNKGTHGGFEGDAEELVRATESMITDLVKR
jgi:DNA repair exonuclease SbcCD ATPase subunit